MKISSTVIVSAVAATTVAVIVPLALFCFSKKRRSGAKDRMDEKQYVKRRKEKIVKSMKIDKADVRFVIGKRGAVIKDIESRCGVRITFLEHVIETSQSEDGYVNIHQSGDSTDIAVNQSESGGVLTEDEQLVNIKGDCNDDISEAMELIREACQLKPAILTETMEIRSEFCGKIIGKGGENLKNIRDFSGTRILISKEPFDGNVDIRLCHIEGTREEIDVAKDMIQSNIMTEIEIRRRREHRKDITEYKPYSDTVCQADSEKITNSAQRTELQVEEVTSDMPHVEVELNSCLVESAPSCDETLFKTEDLTGIMTDRESVKSPIELSNIRAHLADGGQVSPDTLTDDTTHDGDTTTHDDDTTTHDDDTSTQDYNTGVSEFSELGSKASTEFTVNSSYDEVSCLSECSFDKVRTDMRIDEDVMTVEVRKKEEIPHYPLLDTVHLPPLTHPIPYEAALELGSESVETLVPSTPPSSMMSSNSSALKSLSDSGSDVVNKHLTNNLKSMLGITTICSSLDRCDVYDYHNPFSDNPEFVQEFTGIVTAADCSEHVWVVNSESVIMETVISRLASPILIDVPDTIKMCVRYLFWDMSSGARQRVCTLRWVARYIVECCDMDTGRCFCVPVRSLYILPPEISELPAAAVCVSVGDNSEPCTRVPESEILGKVLTVTQTSSNMGANKTVKYPRVKLHCDQIVYTNYRPYVPSPKPSETAFLPHGSSLVYVSAIHNAGHFYVQVCGKNISDLDRLESQMADYYGSVDNLPTYTWEPVPGQLCAVWHTAEKIWLRGQIKELDNSDMLYIKYLDYGDTVHTPRSYTRKLRSEFKDVPYQAIECFLANTIPITTRQWTPEATAKFDALTQCGQWYPLRCVVVGERHGKPCVELYDQPYSDKEYSVGDCLCAMDYARSSKMEVPEVQTLSTPIPSFASGAAYLVSPDFDDVDDELEELFACNDDSDSADSDDFPMSRVNVSNMLMSLGSQLPPSDQSNQWRNKKSNSKHRPQTCGAAKNNAFMERKASANTKIPEQVTQETGSKASYSTQESISDSETTSESEQSNFYDTPAESTSPTTSAYDSAGADFSTTFVAPTATPARSSVTPLHLSSAEDTDCG